MPEAFACFLNPIMLAEAIEHFTKLEFILAFPVGLCVHRLTKRLVLHPYPRYAYGSGLMGGVAIGAVLLVLQFVIGVFHYRKQLSESFFLGGLPAIAYALFMLAVINRLFPRLDRKHPRAFLLRNFQEHSRYIYTCLFIISVISLFVGHYVFLDAIELPQQVCRIVWATIFLIAILVPSKLLWLHMGLFAVALGLLVLFFILLHFWHMT